MLALLHPAPPGSSCAIPHPAVPLMPAHLAQGTPPCHTTPSLPLFSALFPFPSHSSQPRFPLRSPRGKFLPNPGPAATFPRGTKLPTPASSPHRGEG